MFRIKNGVDFKELEKFGFKLNEKNEYEYKNYYPLEDDGTRYEDENGFDYNWRISISRLFNKELWIEIINNDCSYHNEGPDIEELLNKIFDLIQAGLVERVSD